MEWKQNLDDKVVECSLLIGLLQNIFFNCAIGNEPVDMHFPCLTNTVTSILHKHKPNSSPGLCCSMTVSTYLSLLIHRWIPVAVVEDYSVCSGEIDSNPPTAGAENEEEDLWRGVEFLHQNLPLFWLGCAIQPGTKHSTVSKWK